MNTRWVCISADEVHVVPLNDLVGHTADGECVCGPETEPVPRNDGSMGWVVSHQSLDRRELQEGTT